MSPCSGPANCDGRTTGQVTICSTFIGRQKRKRVNISQELHSLQNSPLANAKGAGCGLDYLCLKKDRKEERGYPRKLPTGARTLWFLPLEVMTKNLGLP